MLTVPVVTSSCAHLMLIRFLKLKFCRLLTAEPETSRKMKYLRPPNSKNFDHKRVMCKRVYLTHVVLCSRGHNEPQTCRHRTVKFLVHVHHSINTYLNEENIMPRVVNLEWCVYTEHVCKMPRKSDLCVALSLVGPSTTCMANRVPYRDHSDETES